MIILHKGSVHVPFEGYLALVCGCFFFVQSTHRIQGYTFYNVISIITKLSPPIQKFGGGGRRSIAIFASSLAQEVEQVTS